VRRTGGERTDQEIASRKRAQQHSTSPAPRIDCSACRAFGVWARCFPDRGLTLFGGGRHVFPSEPELGPWRRT